jgi:hypothetical protein
MGEWVKGWNFKELAHMIVGADKSKICRTRDPGRADVVAGVQRQSRSRIPSFILFFFPSSLVG